jgi:hypothetical protein
MEHEQPGSIERLDESAADQHDQAEVVDGVVVVASARTLEPLREGPPPFVQVAAVAATGFMAGAATAAVLGRRYRGAQARRAAAAPLEPRQSRQFPPGEVLTSQRFLVDVYTLARR